MSTTYYAAPGGLIVCVETGMPSDAVRIGIGRTVGAARADLSDTPIQSAGRDPAADALAWGYCSGQWLDIDPAELTRIEVGDEDDDLTSSAWV